MKLRLLILALSIIVVQAAAQDAYIVVSEKTVRMGNDAIERVISLDAAHPGTVSIMNKLSGRRYEVKSGEFALSIVYAGFGPAEGKPQNGENPAVLTASAFRFLGCGQSHDADGAQTLSMTYGLDRPSSHLRAVVKYGVKPKSTCMRKWIELSDSLAGGHFLDRVEVEDLFFKDQTFSRGEFGQPVFVGDLYLGVEYPGVENTLQASHLRSGYVVGEKIRAIPFVSEPGILGVAPSENQLEGDFMRYVETLKVRGTRPFLLYNSWYDLRHPSRTDIAGHAMTEQSVLDRIRAINKNLVEKHGIALDAFVLDDGWDNVQSIWRIDTTVFPHGFSPVTQLLDSTKTRLGLWASPFSGYDMREKRVAWGSDHGYERTGEFLCFAGNRYGREFRDQMMKRAKDDGVGYFKWDGFLLACNEADHGHLPGVYSRRALISTFVDLMTSVRKINPDIFINITVGSWLSPWWLRYADCVWMQGEDYGYAEEVPSLTPRDKAITYRDAVLWQDLRDKRLLFPVSSMMTHGIIKGRFNLLGGGSESLESFTNEVMMYFGRGVMMWELYVSPDLLSTEEWSAIASCVKWARERKDLLSVTRMIGGNPLKNEPYGYVHSDGNRALVLMRNPSVHARELPVSLDRDLGLKPGSGVWRTATTYPYREVGGRTYKSSEEINVKLESHQVVMLEISPAAETAAGTPFDIRFGSKGDSTIVYGVPGSTRMIQLADESQMRKIHFPGSPVTETAHVGSLKLISPGEAKISVSVDSENEGTPSTIAVLVKPSAKLKGSDAPRFAVEVDGAGVTPVVEQENGAWFWVKATVPPGKHSVSVGISGTPRLQANAEAWLFSESPLATATIAGPGSHAPSTGLAAPYSEASRKQSQFVGAFKIGWVYGKK